MCDYTRIKVGDTLKFSEYYIKCFYNIPEEIKRVREVRLRALMDYESPEYVIGCMLIESAGMFIMDAEGLYREWAPEYLTPMVQVTQTRRLSVLRKELDEENPA